MTQLQIRPKKDILYPPGLSIPRLPKAWLNELKSSETRWDEAIKSMLNLSFLRRDLETASISLHLVVHEWIWTALSIESQRALTKIVADMFGKIHFQVDPRTLNTNTVDMKKARDLIRQMRPHMDRCVNLAGPELRKAEWCPLALLNLGDYYIYHHEKLTARSLVRAALARLEETRNLELILQAL